MGKSPVRALTIGHSNHPLELFLALLRQHGVEVLVDTRSAPYSKYSPHFDQDSLRAAIAGQGVRYLYMGRELGGRPAGAEFYDAEGHVLYDRLAASASFQEGLTRLEKGLREFRVALLCSEENPAVCHRHLLIGRVLAEHGVAVEHIRGDGHLQTEAELVRAESGDESQLSLFDHEAIPPWKSIPSVLPKKRQSNSSVP